MPYRIDIDRPPADALDHLVRLGALDVDAGPTGLAAVMPDGVDPDAVARVLNVDRIAVSPARGRDGDSVWVLGRRVVHAGGLVIAPADGDAPPGALRLVDSDAFGTGWHPTTALCLEAIETILARSTPANVLDVGTGSGVLALAALLRGIEAAIGLEIDAAAARAARDNARINGLASRFRVVQGGPDAVAGSWPLVLANILAAPLIDLAPRLVRRVAHRGELVLSGIPTSITDEVERTYRRLGMHTTGRATRAGWSALVLAASW